jgi:hypothetical protein
MLFCFSLLFITANAACFEPTTGANRVVVLLPGCLIASNLLFHSVKTENLLGSGGAILMQGGTTSAVLTDISFYGCYSYKDSGACGFGCDVTRMQRCCGSHCFCQNHGNFLEFFPNEGAEAVCDEMSVLTCRPDMTFPFGKAEDKGGIFLEKGMSVEFTHVNFTNSTSTVDGGSAIYAGYSKVTADCRFLTLASCSGKSIIWMLSPTQATIQFANIWNNTVEEAVLSTSVVGMNLSYCCFQTNSGADIALQSNSRPFVLTNCVFSAALPDRLTARTREGCYGNQITSTYALYYFNTEPCPAVISPSPTRSISRTPTETMSLRASRTPSPTLSMSPTATLSPSPSNSLDPPMVVVESVSAGGAIAGGTIGGFIVGCLAGFGIAMLLPLAKFGRKRQQSMEEECFENSALEGSTNHHEASPV